MPDEQGSLTPVRLLIAESSERSAQRFDSILRDAGIATRVQLVDLPMAGEALSATDVMLCNAELPQLERLLPQLRIKAPDVPIILVDHRQAGMKAAQGLRLGAADVVSGEDTEALLLVFKRELHHVTRTRHLDELQHALQEAEQRCELLLRTSDAAIAYVHEGMHIHANTTYLSLFGFPEVDDVLGLPLMDLLTDATAEALKPELKRFRQQDGERHLPFTARRHDGSLIKGQMTLAAAQYEGEACVQVTLRTTAEPADAVGPEPAQTDSPPGAACLDGATPCEAAPNPLPVLDDDFEVSPQPPFPPVPGTSESIIAQFVSDATRLLANPAPCMAVVVVQVDQFARLQVEHGLRNGELIGARIHQMLRTQLTGYPVVPLAAHQFAVAMRQRDRGHLRRLCEGLLNQLAGISIALGHGNISVQTSIGAGLLETEGTAPPPERIESALDLALATAVRLADAGGNRFEMAGGNLDAEIPDTESGRMLARINRAIEDNAFRLLFQPIISLRGDACEHYEVHLRMISADGSEIRPDAFIDTAIEHGVAGKIDRWVILRAIKTLLSHRAAGHDTRLTINVTANSIADPEFANWLGITLRAARLPSDAVIFQMAEHDIADSLRQAQTFVQALRAMHCQAALARFGVTGDPFERLKLLPVDYVKLDGRLLDHMNADPSGRDLVAQMLGRLQQLGKLSVVPQVETAAMLSVLWQCGANFVQGNYLQPPSAEMDFDFNPAD